MARLHFDKSMLKHCALFAYFCGHDRRRRNAQMKIQRGKWTFEITETDWMVIVVIVTVAGFFATLSILAFK